MPLDTSSMKWIDDKHFYKLTREGVVNRLNKDVNKDIPGEVSGITEGSVFLGQVSDRVKRWLYGYIRLENVRITEKRIADNFTGQDYGIPFREAIEEALYAQVEYMLLFDGDLKAIKESDKHTLVSIEVKEILKSAGIATLSRFIGGVDEADWRVGY